MNKVVHFKPWYSNFSYKLPELVAGLAVFATAAGGGSVSSVASASLAIFFILSLFYIRKWPELWRSLTPGEQLLLVGLALYAFSGLISYYNVGDVREYVKHAGRYVRFLLIVPVYLLLTNSNLRLFRYLLAGAIVAGPLCLSLAFIYISNNPGMPAKWYYHHITFGDAAMLNAVFLSVVLLTLKTSSIMKAAMAFSIACALYASILSQARGAWVALPFCGALLLYLTVKHNKLKIKIILPVLFLSVVVIAVSPVGNIMESRIKEAVQEVDSFVSGERFDSSVGGRLAMWDIAIDVWQEHPIIGTGLGDFDQEIESRQAQGIYENIEVHDSTHNIYFQALATTGTVGFLVLCFALVIQPFRVFYQASSEKLTPASLGGLMLIVAYAVFGLTESWILRSPVVAIYLIYLVTLSTEMSKNPELEGSAS